MIMDKGILKALWAGMFILCAVLGFISEPQGANKVLLIALALLFFLPPALLVWQSWKQGDRKELRLVRNLALISLVGTVVILVANMLSVLGSETLGDVLYYMLIIVSTPMICGQYWAWSLLLWAILLWCCIAALLQMRKKK